MALCAIFLSNVQTFPEVLSQHTLLLSQSFDLRSHWQLHRRLSRPR